jgi:hypothetical protein
MHNIIRTNKFVKYKNTGGAGIISAQAEIHNKKSGECRAVFLP